MCCNESAAPPAKQLKHDSWLQPPPANGRHKDIRAALLHKRWRAVSGPNLIYVYFLFTLTGGFGRSLAAIGRAHAVGATSQGLVLMLLDPADDEQTAALQALVGAIPGTCNGAGVASTKLTSSAAWFVAHACGTLYAFSTSSPTALLQRKLDSFTNTMALAAHGDNLYVWSGGVGGATLVWRCGLFAPASPSALLSHSSVLALT